MAWTQEQLDALDLAIAGGELTVRYGERSVTYRSIDEMLKIRGLMQDSVNADTVGLTERFSFASPSKGL